jgi:hypothetical protein
VGTVKKIISPSEVLIAWDNGTRANYRCSGDEFDLRILDVSQCGEMMHDAAKCNECGQAPLRGIRWTCLSCTPLDMNLGTGVNLCSKCYHDGKHSLKHQFYRMVSPCAQKYVKIVDYERRGEIYSLIEYHKS